MGGGDNVVAAVVVMIAVSFTETGSISLSGRREATVHPQKLRSKLQSSALTTASIG